ncbi:AI-2E family transporter [Sphingomonas sp. Tas61C01]|uniref:AI-2E family transporter n=1 Tax=Sphingomonas sp. Tas61C01 TaxID=3458297 RepID=UPI00403ECC3B
MNETQSPTAASAAPTVRPSRGRGLEPLVPWIIAAIVTAGLYFGRSVLVPITLAILLSFLLAPIVAAFRRARLARTPAVVLALLLSLSAMVVTGAVIASQAATLTKDAPAYAERIAERVAKVRGDVQQHFGFLLKEKDGGGGDRAATRARLQGERAAAPKRGGGAVPVEIREAPMTAMQEVELIVLPALAPIETALIVLIVTIFILFQKEDLRDRLIRLMGTADLHRTTLALDDGAKRLSRYFLSQFIVNCGFGAIIWIGLFLLGVPSPGLWGILSGLLRFVPYVGVLIAAIGPLALAAAIDPGWGMLLSVGLLFVLVEPLIGYAIEPFLYGRSTGLSPVSVVVAALFWTWIWGPLGLVLAMPLTLMLVVLGRHIPAFAMFEILLGDRPALSPAETLYQRALAGHVDEAVDQADDLLEAMPLASYYDDVVLGALRLAAADRDRGVVEREAMHGVADTIMQVLASIDAHLARGVDEAGTAGCLCIPGRGPFDLVVASMTVSLLRRDNLAARLRPREDRAGSGSDDMMLDRADLVCLLGLFDARAARRIRPLFADVEARSGAGAVIIGVQRVAGDPSNEPGMIVHDDLAGVRAAAAAVLAGAGPVAVPV